MNRKELEEAIAEWSKVERSLLLAHLLECAREKLATMPPEDIPPDECLVEVWSEGRKLWKVRYSAGKLDSDNRLVCYVDGNKCGGVSYWGKWRRIPYLLQFTPHDGSEQCPCAGWVILLYRNGTCTSWKTPEEACWKDIVAWAHQKDLVVE